MTDYNDSWEDKPNIAMDKVIETFAYRARLGVNIRIWQTVEMPMSTPGYRDLDLADCPIDIGHHEKNGNIAWRPIEPGWDRDSMCEDELIEFLAKRPPASRHPMLESARNIKPNLVITQERYTTLASIMAQPHEATAAAMERARGKREE